MSDNEDTQALIGDGNQNLELMELDDGPYVQSVNKPSNAWNNKCILQLLLLFILLLVAIGFSINVMPPIKVCSCIFVYYKNNFVTLSFNYNRVTVSLQILNRLFIIIQSTKRQL